MLNAELLITYTLNTLGTKSLNRGGDTLVRSFMEVFLIGAGFKEEKRPGVAKG